MGLVLKVSDSSFEENAVSYLPPVPEGLMYWGFLNDSLSKVGRNFAPGGRPAAVVGSPPVTAKGVVLTSANHIQTAVNQTSAFTLIAVSHPVVDGAESGMFISNYTSPRAGGVAGTSFGVSLYVQADDVAAGTFVPRLNVSSFSGAPGASSVLNQATLPPTDITKPAFLVGTFDAADKIVRLQNLSAGTNAAAAAFNDAVDIGITPFKIGASPLSTYPNKAKNFHFAAIYNRKLTDDEVALVYARVKAYLAARNVIV